MRGQLFRVLLLRRLRLPLLLSARQCRCGRPLDAFGHHRTSCARAGVLGRRGFAVESAGARICREAGGRVVTNAMLRDFDLAAPIQRINGVWRSWRTDCPSSGERSWQSTPRWFPGWRMRMALCCRRHVSGRREHTPRLWDHVAGLSWSSSQARLGSVGPRKPDGSYPCWPERRPGQSHPSCRSELSKRGG